MRGLPHAFRDVAAQPGETLALHVTGPAGGEWTLTREMTRWTLARGASSAMTARVRLTDDVAWRLLFNALPDSEASELVHVEGRTDLATALMRARSVVV